MKREGGGGWELGYMVEDGGKSSLGGEMRSQCWAGGSAVGGDRTERRSSRLGEATRSLGKQETVGQSRR